MNNDEEHIDDFRDSSKNIDFLEDLGMKNISNNETLKSLEIRLLSDAERFANPMKLMSFDQIFPDKIKSIYNNTFLENINKLRVGTDRINDALKPSLELGERIRQITDRFGTNHGIENVLSKIKNQHNLINEARLRSSSFDVERPEIMDLDKLKNPIHETNDRLERIEQRFENMLDVAANGAEIATDLQAHAAEFLVKFENAASNNDRSAARAIYLGAIAIMIALAMPLVQILYTELWRVPQDSAAVEAMIREMQTEITTLRQTQIEAADRISTALERSDEQLIEILRDVAHSLSASEPAPMGGAGPKE